MKPRNILVILTLIWMVAGAGAAVPLGTAFNYQGFLVQNGAPAEGEFDLRFVLRDAPNSGVQQGATLVLQEVAVTNGLFVVQLDFGSPVFTGNALWLETSVRPGASTGSFTVLPPSDELTASPYALYSRLSGDADRLDGLDSSAFAMAGHTHDAGQIVSGTLGQSRLAGLYDSELNLSNPNNNMSGIFSGNGAALQNLNADSLAVGTVHPDRLPPLDAEQLGGRGSDGFWQTDGNVPAPGSFMGTTIDAPLNFRVNNARALRLEPRSSAPNIVGGHVQNGTGPDVEGATISGGGNLVEFNQVDANYGTVGGGANNRMAGIAATIAGGRGNLVRTNADYAIIPGGQDNEVSMEYGCAMGRRAKAVHRGAFVWGDSANQDVASTADDQFTVRAGNGVRLTANAGASKPVGIGDRYRDNGLNAWARIDGDGTVLSEYGVTSAERLSLGEYEITVDASAAIPAMLIPLANPVLGVAPTTKETVRVVSVSQVGPKVFRVFMNRGDFMQVDNEFVFMVTGR